MKKLKYLVPLSAWYGTSYYFLQNPHLIRKKKSKMKLPTKDDGSLYTIAHRGGSREVLENTMQAFKYCQQIGIDIIECDV